MNSVSFPVDCYTSKWTEQLVQFQALLKNKNREEQINIARNLVFYVNYQFHELSLNEFVNFLKDLNARMAELLNSSSIVDKLGCISAIEALIDMDFMDKGAQITRMANSLHKVFALVDLTVVTAATQVLGKLARTNTTLLFEFLEKELKRALEWLEDKAVNCHSALLLLSQLASNAPSLFYIHLEHFFGSISTGLYHVSMPIRLAASDTLHLALGVLVYRDASRLNHQKLCHTLFSYATEKLNYKHSNHILHGSLLTISMLFIKVGELFCDQFDLVYKLAIKYWNNVSSKHIRQTLALLFSLLAQVKPIEFSNCYMTTVIPLFLELLKKNVLVQDILIAIGNITLATKDDIKPYLDSIIPFIKRQFTFKPDLKLNTMQLYCHSISTLGLVYGNIPKGSEPLLCLTMLSKALGLKLYPYIEDMFDLIFSQPLSPALVQLLSSLSQHIPCLSINIQYRLIDVISLILQQKPFHSPRTHFKNRYFPKTTSSSIHNLTPPISFQTNTEPSIAQCTLALRTLHSFAFSKEILINFLPNVVMDFLDNPSPAIRQHAVIACIQLTISLLKDSNTPIDPQSRTKSNTVLNNARYPHHAEDPCYTRQSLILANKVLFRLFKTVVSDPHPSIRLSVLDNLDPVFDSFLVQVEFLFLLFLLVYDKHFKFRSSAIRILCRLMPRNPAYILTALRKRLIQLLSELEYSDNIVSKEESTMQLSLLIANAKTLHLPYINRIFSVLFRIANDPNPRLATQAIEAIGNLAQVSDLSEYLDTFLPFLINTLQNLSSPSRCHAVLITLGHLLQSISHLHTLSIKYTNLLYKLLVTLKSEQCNLMRTQIIKIIGILGALDPVKYRQHLLATSKLNRPNEPLQNEMVTYLENKAQPKSTNYGSQPICSNNLPNKPTKNPLSRGSHRSPSVARRLTMPSTQFTPSEQGYAHPDVQLNNLYQPASMDSFSNHYNYSLLNSEQYYPDAAFDTILSIIRDPSLNAYHQNAFQATMFLFKSIGVDSEEYLYDIIPFFLQLIPTSEITFKEFLFQQLSQLISIVKLHIRPYLKDIFHLVTEYWNSNNLFLIIISLVESIIVTLNDDFIVYMPIFVPLILSVFHSPCITYKKVRLIQTLDILGSLLVDYQHIIIPIILSFINIDGLNSNQHLAITAINCLSRLSTRLQLRDFSLTILHHLIPAIEWTRSTSPTSLRSSTDNLKFGLDLNSFPNANVNSTNSSGFVSNDFLGQTSVLTNSNGFRSKSATFPLLSPSSISPSNSLVPITHSGFHSIQHPSGTIICDDELNTDINIATQGGISSSNPSSTINNSSHYSTHTDLLTASLNLMCIVFCQLGSTTSKFFLQEITQFLRAHKIQSINLESLSAAINDPCPFVFRNLAEKYLDKQNVSPTNHIPPLDLQNISSKSYSKSKLRINEQTLRRAWDTEKRVTKEDWFDWIRKFSIELLRESPSPALRSCVYIADYYPVARMLFNLGFVSCWNELSDRLREELVHSLETALLSTKIPQEVLQMLLDLAEFMEHRDQHLPIDIHMLSHLAEKHHAYAKALYYKELEFKQSSCNMEMVESLISINNKLCLHNAAIGILQTTLQLKNVELREAWYEKLGRWEEALDAYTKRASLDSDCLIGRMRCLDALGEWRTLLQESWSYYSQELTVPDANKTTTPLDDKNQYNSFSPNNSSGINCSLDATSSITNKMTNHLGFDTEPSLNTLSPSSLITDLPNPHCLFNFSDIQKKLANLTCSACWYLQDWERLKLVVPQLDPNQFESSFFQAILSIHDNQFDIAKDYIVSCREMIGAKLTALFGESYQRAYTAMVRVQQLTELEEVIQFKQSDFLQREILKQTWALRLKGCQQNLDVLPHLLAVRALVISPKHDLTAWLGYAALARKTGQLQLSQKVLGLLTDYISASPREYSPPASSPSNLYQCINSNFLSNSYPSLTTSSSRLSMSSFSLNLNDSNSEINMPDSISGKKCSSIIDVPVPSTRNINLTAGESLSYANYSISNMSGAISNNMQSMELLEASTSCDLNVKMASMVSNLTGSNVPFTFSNSNIDQFKSLNISSSYLNSKSVSDMTTTSLNSNNVTYSESSSPQVLSISPNISVINDNPSSSCLKDSESFLLGSEFGLNITNLPPMDFDRVYFEYIKQHRARGKHAQSIVLLRRFVRMVSIQDQMLLARVHYKIGQWMEQSHQMPNESQAAAILQEYSNSIQADPQWYKSYHAWGLVNYELVRRNKKHVCKHRKPTTNSSNSSAYSMNHVHDAQKKERSTSMPYECSFSSSQPFSSTCLGLQSSSPQPQAYVLRAICGFFHSISLNPNESLQDVLRLMTLWFDNISDQHVAMHLTEVLNLLSAEVWLPVIPQIMARIHTASPSSGNFLHSLMKHIGIVHPQAMVYPLTAACKSQNHRSIVAANAILSNMRKHSPQLVDQAALVSHELIRIGIVCHELWREGLQEASQLYFGENDEEGMITRLDVLHEQLRKSPQTPRETNFKKEFGNDLEKAYRSMMQYMKTRKKFDIDMAWDCYFNVFRRINRLSRFSSLDLMSTSPKLLVARNLQLAVPGTYKPNRPIIKIFCFRPNLKVIFSKQRPRKLAIIGSDGGKYRFLLKSREDLRQDERVMQLFGLVNTLLHKHTEKRMLMNSLDLSIQPYSVVPLSPHSGIIEWLPHCDTLHQMVGEYRKARNIPLNLEHQYIMRRTSNFNLLTVMQRIDIFDFILSVSSGMDLERMLWLKSPNSEVWLERRTNYITSLALTSMVGYILGLGDRHPSNLMLDRYTGKIIHIDFGDCFEVALHRACYPELVPFRLTPMLVNALDVSGIQGTFRIICENTMTILRQNKHSLMVVLEAFVHDPLIGWRLLPQSQLQIPDKPNPSILTNPVPTFPVSNGSTHDEYISNPSIVPLTSPLEKAEEADIPQDLPSSRPLQSTNSLASNLPNGYVKDGSPHNSSFDSSSSSFDSEDEADGSLNYVDQVTNDPHRSFSQQKVIRSSQGFKFCVRSPRALAKSIEKIQTSSSNLSDDSVKFTLENTDKFNERALEVINRISDKLSGLDFDKDVQLSVPEQVGKLIRIATRKENLCQAYLGWAAHW